jgi:TetR/AcrR family transcriptional regulator
MPRPARVSPDRILDAAALEFARRGFAGARVDQIARRARVNKAMLYYHFSSKANLYRTLLRRMFGLAAQRLNAIIALHEAPASDKLHRAIAAMASLIEEHAFFPAIMLREVAEGGAHLDRETLATLAAVPRAFGAIVQQGVNEGEFRDVHPVFAYFSMMAPVVFYLAGAEIRKEISSLHLMNLRALTPGQFVQQLQESVRRSLARDLPSAARPTP